MRRRKRPSLFLLTRFPRVRPKLATALLLTAETSNGARIELIGSVPARVVVKGELGAGGDITEREEGEVVKPVVGMVGR